MLRRLLAGAVFAGAAVSVAAVPAHAEPGPGPLAGVISPYTCRSGGGTPIFPPFEQVHPVHTGVCLGGAYGLAPVTTLRSGVPGMIF